MIKTAKERKERKGNPMNTDQIMSLQNYLSVQKPYSSPFLRSLRSFAVN